jgi:hypothetical protein
VNEPPGHRKIPPGLLPEYAGVQAPVVTPNTWSARLELP